MIPKIIHFMWLDKKNPYVRGFPDKYRDNINQWVQMNPDWKVVVWNYEDIENEFPEYMDTFNKIPEWISKCDFARMLVLNKFGGVYTDLDFTPLKPFGDSIMNRDIIVLKEPDQWVAWNEDGRLLVGILACSKNHPFITGWINKMIENTDNYKKGDNWDVFVMTGPRGFYLYYKENPIINLDIKDSCSFMPTAGKTKRKECINIEPFCYTYNQESNWKPPLYIQFKYRFIAGFFLVFAIFYLIFRLTKPNRGSIKK
jgi:mannosyltransferase OCH1-like enzyme